MGEKVLPVGVLSDKILTVRDGFLSCPVCRRNRRLIRILPDTQARRLAVFCRDCKTELIVDIDKGQCFESRSR